MKGDNSDLTKFEQKLETQLLKFDQREKFDFEELVKLSTDVATQIENVHDSNTHCESRLKTFEMIQKAIMNEVKELIQKQHDLEKEFDLTVSKVCDTMNEKLAASESRLALMEMKCSSSEICEDTPMTSSCSVCGKIFRDLNCLEAHFHAQHTGRRQPN